MPPATRQFIINAARAFLGTDAVPPAVAAMLVETKSGPTWHRYVGAIRPWFTHAAAASTPFPALPADPVRFALRLG
jgi:hypothetical protein